MQQRHAKARSRIKPKIEPIIMPAKAPRESPLCTAAIAEEVAELAACDAVFKAPEVVDERDAVEEDDAAVEDREEVVAAVAEEAEPVDDLEDVVEEPVLEAPVVLILMLTPSEVHSCVTAKAAPITMISFENNCILTYESCQPPNIEY
jgi:hypothetical protein